MARSLPGALLGHEVLDGEAVIPHSWLKEVVKTKLSFPGPEKARHSFPGPAKSRPRFPDARSGTQKHELKTIMCQRERQFIQALMEIRVGHCSARSHKLLSRCINKPHNIYYDTLSDNQSQ